MKNLYTILASITILYRCSASSIDGGTMQLVTGKKCIRGGSIEGGAVDWCVILYTVFWFHNVIYNINIVNGICIGAIFSLEEFVQLYPMELRRQ